MHETSRYKNKKGLTNSNYQKLKTLKNKIMKVELKHLSGYLPYGLKGHYLLSDVVPTTKDELRDKLLTLDNVKFFLDYAKPILRPLSEFIDINSESMRELNPDISTQIDLNELAIGYKHYTSCYYSTLEVCFENHIDIYGLIENNLAIDINTLKQ